MKRELLFREYLPNGKFHYWGFVRDGAFIGPSDPKGKHQQFTGLRDKNGKEIYEGDIFRIEENATEVEDVDRIFHVVIVWVKEWAMFCSLLAESEYFDYTDGGINVLDEPMFWTYTLEDTNSRKHFLCGNIFETPELLQNL